MARRLRRNTKDAVFAGVAAGFADYLDVDPLLVRLGFIALAFFGGGGIFLYLIAWVLMPHDREGQENPGDSPADRMAREAVAAGERVVEKVRGTSGEPGRGRLIGGVILIGLGGVFLVERFLPFHWWWIADLWPVALILVGLALIVASRKGSAG